MNAPTIGFIWENDLYGQDAAKIQKTEAHKAGLKTVADIPYNLTSPSLTNEVALLKSKNPDILLANGYNSDAIAVVKAMKGANYSPKVFLANDSGYSSPSFLANLGPDGDGVATRSVANVDLVKAKPALGQVYSMFQTAYGRPMADTALGEFQGLLVLADSINRAGSTDAEAIRKAITQTDLKPDQIVMPGWKGIKFGKDGQNEAAQPIIVQAQGGKYVTVWPSDAATSKVKPWVPWSER